MRGIVLDKICSLKITKTTPAMMVEIRKMSRSLPGRRTVAHQSTRRGEMVEDVCKLGLLRPAHPQCVKYSRKVALPQISSNGAKMPPSIKTTRVGLSVG